MHQWHFRLVGWPWWVVLPLAALAVWSMARWLAPELAPQPPKLRRALRALRCAALALIVLLLLEPTLSKTSRVRDLPLVGVLVDQSGSMDIKDKAMAATARLNEAVALGLVPSELRPVFTNAAAQAQADARLVAGASPDSPIAKGLQQWQALTRFERAVRLATTEFLPALSNRARLKVFGFDEQLSPLDLARPPRSLPGRATDLEAPLTALARQWSLDNVGAVVLISDGRQTAGRDPAPVARAWRVRGATLSTVLAGDTNQPPDAVVAELIGSAEVFFEESVSLDAKFRVTGDDGGEWDMVLSQNGKEVERHSVRSAGQWQYEHFEVPAKPAGVSIFQARLERRPGRAAESAAAPPGRPQPFEEASLANNQAELSVAVNQDALRVFLADATPRWETRYLAALFERDPRVRLERHYHSVIAPQPNLPLLPRTQQEWNEQDLVVLGDLDSSQLTPPQQQFAADFVAKRGGFLVLVAGPRGMPRSFSLGALANLLPVKAVTQTMPDTAPVTLALTDAGTVHPITQILKDPALNQRLWPALPPLQWTASAVAAKPGATVLLEAQNAVRTPIAALHRYGAGRVFWLGTGESWRWRDRLGDRVHQTFWLQAMRWGLAARLRGKDPRLQVGLDRALLAPGESAEWRARATLKNGSAVTTPPRLKLELLDSRGAPLSDSARNLEMKPVPDGADVWQYTLSDLPAGAWRATISCNHPELAGLAETRELLVRPRPGQETLDLSADPAALARLAEAGGHLTGGFDQARRIAQDLAGRLRPRTREVARTYSLWDNYLALLLVLVLLSAEWYLRKRAGLP